MLGFILFSPTYVTKTNELSDEECIELYKVCYIKSCDNGLISAAAIDEFGRKLRQVIEERREKYLANDRIVSRLEKRY
ncbi:MAG TPA: hypothetical protein VD770_01995 [Coxiellaceae bacterium]|nr:hypothetical protein [Coxiellaceae bacterium]